MIELTSETLAEHLRRQGWLGQEPAQVEALGGGVSNAVWRVSTPERQLVVKQARLQLRTREAWFSNIDRIYREIDIMRLLGPLLPPLTVPEVLFEDRANYLFGMSHAPADAVVWKESLLAGDVHPEVARHAGEVLGLMHERTASRPELVERFGQRTVFVQLRVEPFYQRIRERHPDLADVVLPPIAEMRDRCDALCHGDFSPKNILVHSSPPCEGGAEGGGAFTLVDYETAHLGDPAMDLGFFLSHLILKAVKHYPSWSDASPKIFALTDVFWQGYGSVVRFRPLAELIARAIPHFAVCALARIDGTSPVDYLLEEPKRKCVRRFCRQVLRETPKDWTAIHEIVKTWLTTLTA
jgi:5-methylthioribose kinase